MVVWCAYCQTFAGEKEPYDMYEVTHTICTKCKGKNKHRHMTDFEKHRNKLIKDFGSQLIQAGHNHDLNQLESLIEKSNALGIKHIDILIGFITPLLYEVGRLWAEGKITIADEHRFTHTCERALEIIDLKKTINDEPQLVRPDFLIVNAEGNYHTLGVRTLSYWLNANQISNFLVYPSIPNQEIIQLIRSLHPKNLAISIALVNQLPSIVELIDMIQMLEVDLRPQVFVGGYLVKSNPEVMPQLKYVKYISDLSQFKKSLELLGLYVA